MEEMIFKGELNSKEYFMLWFGKRRGLFITYCLLLLLDLIFATLFALSFVLNIELYMALRVISIALRIIISISLGITWYYCFTTGGLFPRGMTRVYKLSEDSVKIERDFKGKSKVKVLKIDKKEILKDHLYIEESRKNFAFLPKDINLVFKNNCCK